MKQYIKDILTGHLDDLEIDEVASEVHDYMIDDDIEDQYSKEECETLMRKMINKMKAAI